MVEEKRFYVLGKVSHQDDTSPIELLGDKATEPEVSDLISRILNDSFPPKNIFVIEGVRKEIKIKGISFK